MSSNNSSIVTHWLTCTILKTGAGILVHASLNFQCGKVFERHLPIFWIFFFWYSYSWCSGNRPNMGPNACIMRGSYLTKQLVEDYKAKMELGSVGTFSRVLRKTYLSNRGLCPHVTKWHFEKGESKRSLCLQITIRNDTKAYRINQTKFHKTKYWYMMKQPKSNLHVLGSCEQQRLLSPCRSATFVKEIERETRVFK